MTTPTTNTTLIIPTVNAAGRLPYVLESLKRTAALRPDVMILRHYRPDAEREADRSYDRRLNRLLCRSRQYYKVAYHGPFNYSAMMNYAVARLRRRTDDVCFVNDDVLFGSPDWLSEMKAVLLSDPAVGVVGCKLLYPNLRDAPLGALCRSPEEHFGDVQHGGAMLVQKAGALHLSRHLSHRDPKTARSREVDAVTFALALVRRSVLDDVRFDELLDHDYNDTDFCLQVGDCGGKIFYCASSVHFHLETLTRRQTGERNSPANVQHFMRKWKRRLAVASASKAAIYD